MSNNWSKEDYAKYIERQRIKAGCDSHQSYRKEPQLEQSSGNAPLGKNEVKERDSRRYDVIFTTVRKRLLDEDNICEKFHVDAIRYAGILSSDAAEQTKITPSQRKCEKGEEEHVEIVVTINNSTQHKQHEK